MKRSEIEGYNPSLRFMRGLTYIDIKYDLPKFQ